MNPVSSPMSPDLSAVERGPLRVAGAGGVSTTGRVAVGATAIDIGSVPALGPDDGASTFAAREAGRALGPHHSHLGELS